MQVKYFEDAPVEDLGLTMTVAMDTFGLTQEIELLPNGANVPVTNENRLMYVSLYANWLLNGRIKEQNHAFVRGMRSVFSEEFFSIFYPEEIDTLISGGKSEIDTEDLRKFTKYQGWDLANDGRQKEYLNHFWGFLARMPNDQKEKLLLFATGAERSPLLGFGFMSTPFTIAKREMAEGQDRAYPTASTCVNMLSLPYFGYTPAGLVKMEETLTEAINSNQGFYLA